MIILGINEGHNATAAIVRDGHVLGCASEERFSRKKNDIGYPRKAIESILEMSGLTPKDIDYVACGGIYSDPMFFRLKKNTLFTIKDYIREMHEYWKPTLLENKESDFWERMLEEERFQKIENQYYDFRFMEKFPLEKWGELFNQERVNAAVRHMGVLREKVRFIDHHKGHAHYALYASPHDENRLSVIITADGWGDGCNASISIFQNGKIQEIHRTPMCQLARIYRWITLLLGMKPYEHEYKVMGLAPYAKEYIKEPAYKILKETLVVDGIDFRWNKKPSDMYFYFKERFEGLRFDGIASAVQSWLEDLLSEWFQNIMRHTGAKTIYYSGGLSMNVKANKIIADMDSLEDFYVPPSGGDESLAMGAAFALGVELGDKPAPLKNGYLGYSPKVEEAYEAVQSLKTGHSFNVIENPKNDLLADILAQGKVLGRCMGNMEFGARALGNRSVLCDPSKYENLRLINEKIKFRDFWMPFTPSILAEREKDYIVNKKGIMSSYMTIGFDSTPLGRNHLRAAIHPYDFTVRPQRVTAEGNPGFYELIKAFEEKTGIGALLNTSLNLHGSPIAGCVVDAIEVFVKSDLDGLILPGFLVLKE